MKLLTQKTMPILMALMLLLCTLLIGCGNMTENAATTPQSSLTASAANTTKSDETLTVMLNAEPSGLVGEVNEGGLIVLDSISGSILEYDGINNSWKPGLCSGFEKVDDTHYTFALRPDAIYSDGSKVTVEDCVFSLGFWKGIGSSNAQYFNMDETKVVDDTHFTLALTEYVPGWEIFVAMHTGTVFSEKALNAVGGEDGAMRTPPVMAGRYLVTDWQPGSFIMTERADTYYDTDYVGYYKYIKYVFVADSASRVLSVKSNDADIALRITAADVRSLQGDDTIQSFSINDQIYNVYFNNESGPCADPKVRKALTYAIDGNAVNASVMLGYGELNRGWLLPSFPYFEEHELIQYDPDYAKQLLAEAGYPDGISLYLPVIGTHRQFATVVQESMRKAGIDLTVDTVEQQNFLKASRSGEFDLICGANTPSYGPAVFNQVDPALTGKSPQNCRIPAGEIDKYVAMAKSPDPTVEKEGWHLLQNYIFDNYCLAGACTSHVYAAMKSNLTGYTTANNMGYANLTEVHPVQ